MSLADVSLQFLVQTAFGSMLTFAIADRKALGPKYFKLGGWVLLALYGLALTLVWDSHPVVAGTTSSAGQADGSGALFWSVAAAAGGVLLFASASGWAAPGIEAGLLWIAIAAGGAAVAAAALSAPLPVPLDASGQALRLAGAYGSALTLGFTTWGMILGHWYLVSQGLSVHHLARLVAPLPWLLLARAAISGFALWWMWDRILDPGAGPARVGSPGAAPNVASLGDLLVSAPERVLDLVNVLARIPVGLLVPAVLAFMARVTVKMERTQPATGILYAMCVLVFLGELMGKMVEGGTGVPL